jgi:dTMP kinase|tara:strand:- start:224 stop:856 length:633 start_codon:yes stop_codon:yes gene_type:complete
MYKKKSLFITFEGIEGSGKTYQSKKLYKNILKKGIRTIFTREPGGSKSAEMIRKLILSGSKNKFADITDTLLYLASRNEHIINTIKPALKGKKVIVCDRFYDSTTAYQVYGKRINSQLIKNVHDHILQKIKPDITFILIVNINKAFSRMKKRKTSNRYDKFTKNFYSRVQDAFIKVGKKNKNRYIILDNTNDSNSVEKTIFKEIMKKITR